MALARDDVNLAKSVSKIKIVNLEPITLDSDEDEEPAPKPNTADLTLKRTAKKSTATRELQQPPAASTRRQVALNNSIKRGIAEKPKDNFDPEMSARERRKLARKLNVFSPPARRPPGAVYDELGVHINTGVDLCDCLQRLCPGCHFPCPKCGSSKCGPECRVHRKFSYELLEYQGCDLVVRNPLYK